MVKITYNGPQGLVTHTPAGSTNRYVFVRGQATKVLDEADIAFYKRKDSWSVECVEKPTPPPQKKSKKKSTKKKEVEL